MEITKEDYYKLRAETYPFDDQEALIRYGKILDWLDLKEGVVIREIGCKFAVLRDLLDKHVRNADYIAVDIDEATLRKIPKYNPEQFICHNVNEGFPFHDSSVDYLVCLEVLEHLENPTSFMAEVNRILKPGGKLVLSVPNPYCWMEWLGNYRKRPDSEGHISSFTYQNIDALLRFEGLVLSDIKGTFTRIPFSRRLFGNYKLMESKNMLLTRSFMFLIEKQESIPAN